MNFMDRLSEVKRERVQTKNEISGQIQIYKRVLLGCETPTILTSKFTFTLLGKCFEQAYNEVISPKNWTVILASHQCNASIFAFLPKELIASIFKINHEIGFFEIYNTKITEQGTAVGYMMQISETRNNSLLFESLNPGLAKNKQSYQDRCFVEYIMQISEKRNNDLLLESLNWPAK